MLLLDCTIGLFVEEKIVISRYNSLFGPFVLGLLYKKYIYIFKSVKGDVHGP